MKKKIIALVLAGCMLCFGAIALTACGGSSSSSSASSSGSASSASGSASTTKFIVGFDQGFKPFGYKDTTTGQITGFDLDLAKEVCKRNGWEYAEEAIDWDAKDALINQGNITCIWNGFTYEGRENDYAFSGQYMDNAQIVAVKAGSGITSTADLAGKNVITQVDSAALEVLDGDKKSLQDTFAGGKVQTISDYLNAFMQLESGAVDAVVCDRFVALSEIAAKPDAFKILDEELSTEHYAVGFKKGNEQMAETVTKTLKEMDADGTIKTICEKYASEGIDYKYWCLK